MASAVIHGTGLADYTNVSMPAIGPALFHTKVMCLWHGPFHIYVNVAAFRWEITLFCPICLALSFTDVDTCNMNRFELKFDANYMLKH